MLAASRQFPAKIVEMIGRLQRLGRRKAEAMAPQSLADLGVPPPDPHAASFFPGEVAGPIPGP
ncbi:MAG: hypothetical protein NZM27_02760 [Acetobacteraceae bacterium]|nr:hypothetical protein [Acetobacteraceae bacterium]MDW8397505.1 hypothetical protein [Acetobacteraceae bacterium]